MFTPEEERAIFDGSVPDGFRESMEETLRASGRSVNYWVNWLYRNWLKDTFAAEKNLDPETRRIFRIRFMRDVCTVPSPPSPTWSGWTVQDILDAEG